MRRNSIREVFYDIVTIFFHRMKLIGKDKTTLFILFSSTLLFAFMFLTLTSSANDLSALPIGVVDYDGSISSKELIGKLKMVPSLKVIEKKEEELHKLLLDEMITSIYIINKGYDQKLRSGELKGMISMYYMKDNKAASVISDIIAGEMMYSVCFYKAYQLYERIPFVGKKHTAILYEEYMDRLLENSWDFDFAFQINYVNKQETIIQEEAVSNSVLYHQFVFGILGIFMGFIAMYILSATVWEKEIGVAGRLRISRFQSNLRDIGNFIALLFIEGLISLGFSGLIYAKMQWKDFKLFSSIYFLLVLNALVLGGIFLLISKIIKSIIAYQLLCSTLILVAGGLGFYHLLTGFYQSIADIMIKIIPNSWFIQGFTDIIIYGSKGGYIKDGHLALLLMLGTLIFLIIISNLIGKLINHSIVMKDRNRTVN